MSGPEPSPEVRALRALRGALSRLIRARRTYETSLVRQGVYAQRRHRRAWEQQRAAFARAAAGLLRPDEPGGTSR